MKQGDAQEMHRRKKENIWDKGRTERRHGGRKKGGRREDAVNKT